jgi:hypothetical protein
MDDKKKLLLGNELFQLIEKQKKSNEVNENVGLNAIPYFRKN